MVGEGGGVPTVIPLATQLLAAVLCHWLRASLYCEMAKGERWGQSNLGVGGDLFVSYSLLEREVEAVEVGVL